MVHIESLIPLIVHTGRLQAAIFGRVVTSPSPSVALRRGSQQAEADAPVAVRRLLAPVEADADAYGTRDGCGTTAELASSEPAMLHAATLVEAEFVLADLAGSAAHAELPLLGANRVRQRLLGIFSEPILHPFGDIAKRVVQSVTIRSLFADRVSFLAAVGASPSDFFHRAVAGLLFLAAARCLFPFRLGRQPVLLGTFHRIQLFDELDRVIP